jgi:hypothetical protein
MAGLYPLPMRFPVPINGGPGHIDIAVKRDGWEFVTLADRQAFEGMPVADRLEYRRAFEAQVALAKDTPTKGDQ